MHILFLALTVNLLTSSPVLAADDPLPLTLERHSDTHSESWDTSFSRSPSQANPLTGNQKQAFQDEHEHELTVARERYLCEQILAEHERVFQTQLCHMQEKLETQEKKIAALEAQIGNFWMIIVPTTASCVVATLSRYYFSK